jgi:hypothetical protein
MLLAGGAGWGISDCREQRHDFCNACHLSDVNYFFPAMGKSDCR